MSDWNELSRRQPRDNDLPARAWRLATLDSVLTGRMYDPLRHPFSMERSPSGEYVPLGERRPSVRTNLCRTVVDDSVSLLFSEGHWPSIRAKNAKTTAALAALTKDALFNAVMIDAATRGSVGSVAIQVAVIEHLPRFCVLSTAALTPTWNGRGELVRLVERYKVSRQELIDRGYSIDPDCSVFWFQRMWDDESETWYLPQSMADAKSGRAPQIDPDRSVTHGLGLVPVVWIRNLPGGDELEGSCTFEAAIDDVIEIDYLLSQAGRALKYGSDPTLVLKTAETPDGPARTGGAANALSVPPEGDAKLLEINGSAATAVLEHVRYLRSLALEAMHGNRSDSDRVTAAQSGRAIELMHSGLINLTDRLRIAYGEGGLLPLMRMVCALSSRMEGGIEVGGKRVRGLDPTGLALHWPAYFPPTFLDGMSLSQGLTMANDGGIVSRETAATLYATAMGLDDAAAEWKRIQAEKAEAPVTPPPVTIKEIAA